MLDYVCPVCGNKDLNSIGFKNGKPYCRKCIAFKGQEPTNCFSYRKNAPIKLDYKLSDEQRELSKRLVNNIITGVDSLVYAVCGSGKTEICLGAIQHCIISGQKVGFAVPRRSVCYELYLRFKSIFTDNSIVAVFGGHHKRLEADIVCLTTHQLFRYNNYFDLLIMDEIDAFPYKGNDVLEALFKRSVKGRHILLTATPSQSLLKEYQKPGKDLLKLFIRFHRHPLPVPEVVVGNDLKIHYKLIKYIKEFLSNNKKLFIFVPTVDQSIKLAKILGVFFHRGTYINSKRENNESLIEDFRNGKYEYLVTTAVLERGVTIKDLQVIVFHADSEIYDDHALIQIAGRAGRKKDAPEGRVIFIGKRKTEHMERAIGEIITANKELQNMLQRDKNR